MSMSTHTHTHIYYAHLRHKHTHSKHFLMMQICSSGMLQLLAGTATITGGAVSANRYHYGPASVRGEVPHKKTSSSCPTHQNFTQASLSSLHQNFDDDRATGVSLFMKTRAHASRSRDLDKLAAEFHLARESDEFGVFGVLDRTLSSLCGLRRFLWSEQCSSGCAI